MIEFATRVGGSDTKLAVIRLGPGALEQLPGRMETKSPSDTHVLCVPQSPLSKVTAVILPASPTVGKSVGGVITISSLPFTVVHAPLLPVE